ncbi:MAG TPA: hypothetical protein VF290_28770 [Pyrinomonadaceae bacterium]
MKSTALKSVNRGAVRTLFLIVSLSFPLAAQDIVTKPGNEGTTPKPIQGAKPKSQPGDQKQSLDLTEALSLVDHISELTADIKDDQTRVQIQARVADALWDINEDRARRLFESAFVSIDSIKFERETAVTSILKELSEQSQLRNEVLRLVSRHDLTLSAKLLKSVTDDNATTSASAFTLGTKSTRASLYLQIAVGLADSDPNGAAQMIRASLESGVDPQIAPALIALRRRNIAAADSLFRLALLIAQRDIAQTPLTVNYLAPYVFPNYGQGINYFQFDLPSSAASQGNDMVGEFLKFAYAMLTREIAAAKPGANATLAAINYSTAKMLLPYFDQYMPDAAVVIRTGVTQLAMLLNAPEAQMIDTFTGFNDVEEILERAERTKQEEIRDAIYSRAAILSARNGDTDRALSIIEKIRNESLRSDFNSIIRYQAAIAAIGKSDAELALRFAKDIGDLQMYATAMSRLATLLQQKKNSTRADEILTEAARTITRAENGFEKVCAMLIVTNVASELDATRGFEMMNSAVRIINQTDIHLNRSSVVAKGATKPGVLSVMNAASGLNSMKLDESFAWLARSDFQRALSLARSFDKKEATVLAQLAACKGLMAKIKETSKPAGLTRATQGQSTTGNNVKRPDEQRLEKAP